MRAIDILPSKPKAIDLKTWKIINAILAVLVFVTISLNYKNIFVFAAVAFISFSTLSVINFIYIRRSQESEFYLILPSLFLMGLYGLVSAISWSPGKIIVGIFGMVLLYNHQAKRPGHTPIHLEELFSTITGFFLLVWLSAVNYYFSPEWWVTSILVCGFSFLFYLQVLYKLGKFGRIASLGALASSLVMVEFFWASLFWPVHYLTSAVVLFAVFYVIYIFSRLYFIGELTRKKAYFQIGLMLVFVLSVILSASWQP